jgi:glycerol uptake facilitator-like aquaporin
MAKKSKKNRWFIPVRGSYLPNSWQAWLLYIPFTAYLVFTLVAGWQNTDNTSQAALFIIPNWVVAAIVMTWVAKRTS